VTAKETLQINGILAVLVETAERSMRNAAVAQLRGLAKKLGEGTEAGSVLLRAVGLVEVIPLSHQTTEGQPSATT